MLDTLSAWAVSSASWKLCAHRKPFMFRDKNQEVPVGFGNCSSSSKLSSVCKFVVFIFGGCLVDHCDSWEDGAVLEIPC